MVTKGKGGRDKLGVWDQQITIYEKEDLLYSTGKYIQYLVIIYNGKNLKKNMYTYIYMCVCVCVCVAQRIKKPMWQNIQNQ